MDIADIQEVVDLLGNPRPEVRLTAARTVAALTAEETLLRLLVEAKAPTVLVPRIADLGVIAIEAVGSLVNLCGDVEAVDQMLRANLVNQAMECLASEEYAAKALLVALLNNVTAHLEGSAQLLQRGQAIMGLHFRRLLQWFLEPVPAGEEDSFQYVGNIAMNLTQLPEARALVLDPERGIFAAMLPQLHARNPTRRIGVAGMIKNCCFDRSAVEHLLSWEVNLIPHLLEPMVGRDKFFDEEVLEMPERVRAALARGEDRESEPSVRRSLVESLFLLASHSIEARKQMNRMQAPAILTHLQVSIEGIPDEGKSAADLEPEDLDTCKSATSLLRLLYTAKGDEAHAAAMEVDADGAAGAAALAAALGDDGEEESTLDDVE